MTKPKLQRQQIEVLYQSHAPAVRRFVLGVLKDHDLADEALQQTFVQLMEQGHTARTESMRGWIFKVAFHQAIALRRRLQAQDRVSRQFALESIWQRQDPSAGDQVLDREDLDRAQAAVAGLPATQREILRLRFQESKTFAQIAEQIGVPLGTALTRMRLALTRLRRVLQ